MFRATVSLVLSLVMSDYTTHTVSYVQACAGTAPHPHYSTEPTLHGVAYTIYLSNHGSGNLASAVGWGGTS